MPIALAEELDILIQNVTNELQALGSPPAGLELQPSEQSLARLSEMFGDIGCHTLPAGLELQRARLTGQKEAFETVRGKIQGYRPEFAPRSKRPQCGPVD